MDNFNSNITKIFRKAEEKSTRDVVTQIKTKNISRTYTFNDDTCEISINGAKFGEVNGTEKLLDEAIVMNMMDDIFQSIKLNRSKYNAIPKRVVLHSGIQATEEKKKESEKDPEKKEEFINSYSPRWSFDEVYLEEGAKKQILSALTISKYKDKLFNEWGLKGSMKNGRAVVLNFFGPPGTGKSITAEAIASYLNKEVYSVNYAELESKYVGETPKNIKKAFELASEKGAVLVFDEADSFLGKRLTNVSQSADYGVNITRSVMLMEIEKFDGVVIFTTNLINNYDEAFKRRILASVEFKHPDLEGKKNIWRIHIPKELPLDEAVTIDLIAEKFSSVSGADIKDIILYAAVICLQRDGEKLVIKDFEEAYSYVMNRYKGEESFNIKHEVITEEEYKKENKID